ncbi:hypothetical protein PINS_up002093 [Pythium insidiosum]|nr:hypothetical protein PINS_up002093 [Pythium insidiosum]
MRNGTTQFFHTRDPIENLRIRVVARKIQDTRTRVESTERKVPIGATWSYTFRWQEKRPSSHDVVVKKHKSKLGKKPKTADAARARSDGQLQTSERGDEAVAAALGVALCSFIDADHFVPARRRRDDRVSTSLEPPPHLVSALYGHSGHPRLRNSPSAWATNRERVALRIRRESVFRDMHITLRLEEHDEDVLLASLRFYLHSGLLCVAPGFSDVMVDDRSVEEPILSTFQVTSRVTGERFEFALDNESDLLPMVGVDDAEVLRALQREEMLEAQHRLQAWHGAHGDSDTKALRMKETPNRSDADHARDQLLIQLEIVSLSRLDTPNAVQVLYELQTLHEYG